MRVVLALVSMSLLAAPVRAHAQHGGTTLAPVGTAPREVSQYDFMVGDWELDVHPAATSLATRIHGMPKLVGTWKVRKALDGWGLEDDLRITDEAGNPSALVHSVRYYDRGLRRWIISGLDVYRGKFTTSTADWRGNTMELASTGKDPDGKVYMVRTHIYDITPTGFRFLQDRSEDLGKSWKEGTLKIEARRAGSRSD